MANRTIQFCGYAYGDVPVQLNAHINGQLVFSGAVDTLNENIAALPADMTNAPVLFSVAESELFPTNFAGSYPMTVSVATGTGILLGYVYSNYMTAGTPPGPWTTGTADVFLPCYRNTPPNSDGTGDSRSSVQLNGVAQDRSEDPYATTVGQWTWEVSTGSTIEYNFNISTGSE
jgi:hypothetical protein